MADGHLLPPMPFMLTEFGGIGFAGDGVAAGAWGYAGVPRDAEAFRTRFESIFRSVEGMREICGWVYTQLTDVQQEINGLLTADRKHKFDPAWLRRWVAGKP